MRTKTNIFTGEGVQGFMQYLNKSFTAGNLAIIYDDKVLAYEVFSKLDIAMYKARLITISESFLPLNESVRFIIAVGSEKAIEAVKKHSEKRTFCYYPNEVCHQIFSSALPSSGEIYSFAEFAYYDSTKLSVRDTKTVYDAYSNVFSVFTECILNSYYESSLPYTDKGLSGIIESAKKLLTEGCDIDKFFVECFRLMKTGVEYLQEKGNNMFFDAKAVSLGKLNKEYIFVIDYFVNLIAINFTKWNFFDMLIPAEKLVLDIPATKPNYRQSEGMLLKKEELSLIACKAKNLTDLPKVESKEIIKLIIDTVTGSTPLLAEINNRGILEGLVNYG